MRMIRLICVFFLCSLAIAACKKEAVWMPGTPLPKEKIKIGVMHISDPFSENSGYSYAHQLGIEEMKQSIGLTDSQIIQKVNVFAGDPGAVEEAMRDCIAEGANVIFATSWDYMDTCEKLAREFPQIIFAHAAGNKCNDTNFTNFFARAYHAKYLSGIVAGMKTKTGKIGHVAPWGMENSEVTGNLNAFALGVEKVNPHAKIYVKVTHSWFDPLGESVATRALIAGGCDIINQDVDSPAPQIEAEKAGVWGIGFNTDMRADAPATVLTSVIWRWGAYYSTFIQSIIDGTFTTEPYLGSLKDGIVEIAPLNTNINWEQEIISIFEEERRRIESGTFDVFSGVMETNDGRSIGSAGYNLSEDEIKNGINWYYRNIAVMD